MAASTERRVWGLPGGGQPVAQTLKTLHQRLPLYPASGLVSEDGQDPGFTNQWIQSVGVRAVAWPT